MVPCSIVKRIRSSPGVILGIVVITGGNIDVMAGKDSHDMLDSTTQFEVRSVEQQKLVSYIRLRKVAYLNIMCKATSTNTPLLTVIQ